MNSLLENNAVYKSGSALLEQGDESRLLEMGILRECFSKPPLFHDAKAQAVGVGPGLIRMFQKIVHHRVKSFRIGPFDLAHSGCEHAVEEIVQQVTGASGLEQP